MKRNRTLLFVLVSIFYSTFTYAQKNVVNVNPLTGSGSVVIPVYQIKRGQITLPISLVYNATGVKPKDVEGSAGMGWQLQAGGAISRKVRGLPDDVMKDNADSARLGWMYNTNATKINSFAIANDNNPSTCTDGTNDVSYITSNFGDNSDTEPDIFYVNAPGLSCELIFDQASQQFKPVKYQDITITYTAYSSTATYAGQIMQFTITNDKGIRYNFGSPDQIREWTYGTTTPTYFKRQYAQFRNQVTYFNNWHLTSIFDNNGSGVILNYGAATARTGTDAVSLYMPGATSATLQYKTIQTVTPQVLTKVSANYDVDNLTDILTINWTQNTFTTGGTDQSLITSITGAGRNFNFSYGDPYFNTSLGNLYKREFLAEFSESGCSSPVDYKFSYNGVDFDAATTTLPDSTTKQVDYWGYYDNNTNTSLMPKVWIAPSSVSVPQYSPYLSTTVSAGYPYYTTTGNIRAADAANIITGSLNKITHAEGGSTTITYEPNDYIDVPSGVVVQGNGLRIKQVVDDDGFGTGNPITRNYSYLNPATGKTSGEPLSLPCYAFMVPYSGANTGNALYNSATVLSDNDLSDEDHTIMYSYVKTSQTGAGSTLYQYYVPANYWNTTAAPACQGCSTADYSSTLNNSQRISCASVTGPIANNIYGFPFAPNENYDFERGLVQKVTAYNDAGTEVSETSYSYQRSYNPTVINGLTWEDNPYPNNTAGVRTFAKYQTNYNTSELLIQKVSKVFDSGTLSQAQTSTVNYTYGSSFHKLLTREQSVNSDNSTVTTNIKYVKDYLLASSTNRNINALYNLQLLNMNFPVETYRQVTRAGVTKTTSASLTYFLDFPIYSGLYKYRPAVQYNFFSSDGVTDFVPSSISGTTYSRYGGYYAAANYTGYNILGDLQTFDDAHQHVKAAIQDNLSGQPAISIVNAGASEVFFNDFDSDIQAPWSTGGKTGTSSYVAPAGSHNGLASGLGTGQTFTYTINKNVNAANYIFSAWVNTLAAGTITFLTTPSSGTAVSSTQTLASTSGAWKYMEWKVPVNTMTATFTIAVSANINFGADDIIFYPETASVTTYAYDPVTHFNTSVTNTNGVSAYYTDDIWGRPVYAMDQDHNIVKKASYVTGQLAQAWNPSAVSSSGSTYKNIAQTFGVQGGYDVCETVGTVVNWNFGDGGTASSVLGTSPPHTYTGTGTFTVSATVYSPIFGSKVLTPLSVTVLPTPVTITITNTTSYPYGVLSTTFYSPATGQTYTFSGITGGSVPPDTYTVNVYVSGGQLYNSGTGAGYSGIMLSGSCMMLCKDYTSNNRATFIGVNVSSCSTVNVSINRQTCAQLTN